MQEPPIAEISVLANLQPGCIFAVMMNRRNFIALSLTATAAHAGSYQAPEDEEISFGVITDIQYADADPVGERHFRESIPKIKAAVEILAPRKLPFTLHLGDFIDDQFSSIDAILPLLEPIGHRFHHLLGNHDFSVAPEEKPQVRGKLGMPADYYSFVHGGLRFLMMDTNDISTYKHLKGSPQDLESVAMLEKLTAKGLNSAKPWNGGVSKAQIAWLEQECAAATVASQRVILCGHHPILPAEGLQIWNCQKVLDAIDRHASIVAYFSGHNHAGSQIIRNGIPYITFKSMLHEPGITAYSIIHVSKNSLRIEGFGRELSRVCALNA